MTSRADMHCHSTASQLSRLGVQRSLGLPECATPPQEVYELAKRRGMDFVTITDHDTIDGALELEHLPDTFVSEELTVRFAGEPQAVHVLCYGITLGDHEWLQAHAGDVEACAAYLHENGIACALAHPFFNVAAPLTRRHRRRLAELFPIWEIRNGSRAAELNMPAAVYVDTRGGTGIGGSDDHAGVDIGRTWTEVPGRCHAGRVSRPHAQRRCRGAGRTRFRREVDPRRDGARHPRPRRRRDRGLRHRSRPGRGAEDGRTGDRRGLPREGKVAADIGPEDARCLLEAWLAGVGIEARGRDLLEMLQADGFSHADLYRRARRRHERRLRLAVDGGLVAFQAGDLGAAASGIFEALVPAVPYAPSTAFLGQEKAKLRSRDDDRRRVALIADGIGSMHGVTHTIEQIRERGVPGFDVEVIGTDPGVDRRLPAACELELPFYQGMRLGVPGVPDLVEVLAEGGYDLVHVTAPGPAGIAATLLGRITGDAAARQLPHRARHLRRAARRRDARGGRPGGPRRLLQRPGAGPLAEPGGRRLARRARHRRRQGRSLGARGGRRALRSRRRPTATATPVRSKSSTPVASRARRGSTCSPSPSSAPTRPTRACTCCWRAVAPRRRSCAGGSAMPPPSSAGSAARTSRSPTRAPTSSSSAVSPTPTAR